MAIPYLPRVNKRRPHYWKIRKQGFREFTESHGWRHHGYGRKMFKGHELMMTTVSETTEYNVVCITYKDNFWADITDEARSSEAVVRREKMHVVRPEKLRIVEDGRPVNLYNEEYDEFVENLEVYGRQVAEQEFTDASILAVYEFNGYFYCLNEDGLYEYDDAYSAMRQNGFEVDDD